MKSFKEFIMEYVTALGAPSIGTLKTQDKDTTSSDVSKAKLQYSSIAKELAGFLFKDRRLNDVIKVEFKGNAEAVFNEDGSVNTQVKDLNGLAEMLFAFIVAKRYKVAIGPNAPARPLFNVNVLINAFKQKQPVFIES